MTQSKPKVAVITGWHPFDAIGFADLLRSMSDTFDLYPQEIDNFAVDCAGMRKQYDALVFYNMNMATPSAEAEGFEPLVRTMLEELGETPQGIVLLHHAILSYPDPPFFSEIAGIGNRQFGFHIGQELTVQVANADHPITQGVGDWQMTDETYTMDNAGDGSEVLLTADHPKSMQTVAWTRRYRESPVFCFQCGHDRLAWDQPNFRAVLKQGILWTVENR